MALRKELNKIYTKQKTEIIGCSNANMQIKLNFSNNFNKNFDNIY